jgi:hypothetical protein
MPINRDRKLLYFVDHNTLDHRVCSDFRAEMRRLVKQNSLYTCNWEVLV